VSGEEGEPLEQYQPFIWPEQSERQPRSSRLLPSSQVSYGTISNPSPQVVWQVSGCVLSPPEQYHPLISPEQSALHPSPSLISLSSQGSETTLIKSPHMAVHTEFETESPGVQDQPGILPVQSDKQPLLSLINPSSHISVSITKPSPQKGMQMSLDVREPLSQKYFKSVPEQSGLQPRESRMLPSSQSSGGTRKESPQLAVQVERDPGVWVQE